LGGADLLQTDAPSQVEITLGRKDTRYLVHITDCSAGMGDRFGPVEADAPLLGMNISLAADRLGKARHVRMVPEGKDVQVVERAGRLEFEAKVRLHSIYEMF
jgi:hypothetical protein